MNKLSAEKSPYLIQHKNNPVHWWSWSEQAIEEARKLDKPIFLSIGYSTCYWCHVMEKECFEDTEVARALNEDFVCIKIDREERPDIDAIYMEAVVALNGHGGWPLSVFLDTELKPFFGGTYFPKDNFLEIIAKLSDSWKNKREQITQASAQLYDVMQVTSRSTQIQELQEDLWQQTYQGLKQNYDSKNGGFGSAPKFPAAGSIRFLLRYYRRFNEEDALQMALHTLEAMAKGGLYDQLGGGFHRYSTDEQWLVPHFEKMLYDNALLIPAYLEAWQLSPKPFLKEVASASLEYILREMRTVEGAFYSAQDAGEVSREGEYYTWTEQELLDVLEIEEYELVKETFGINAAGNFESGLCIPRVSEVSTWEQRYSADVVEACNKLLDIRQTRRAPHLDNKILCAWNALAISAFAKGYQVLEDTKYLKAAQTAASFIKDNLYHQEELYRRYCDGERKYFGYLEDYSFLIQALLDLYQSDSSPQWVDWAIELQKKSDELFWDSKEGGYFSSSPRDKTVLVQKKEHSDTALPSASAIAAINLHRLFSLTKDEKYLERSRNTIGAYSGFLKRFPAAFSYSMMALEYDHFGAVEVVITANPQSSLHQEVRDALFQQFQPTLVLISEGSAAIDALVKDKQAGAVYLCYNSSCSAPFTDSEAAISELKKYQLQ